MRRFVVPTAAHAAAITIYALLASAPVPAAAQAARGRVTSGAAPGYTEDAVCATCHRELHESYQSVGMSRSFYRPRADRMIEDFDNNHYFHEPSGRHYEMRFDEERMTITRYQLDAEGRRANVLEQEIDWILGSGSRARSYIYRTEAGELFLAPISWYSQPGAWRMAPGYDRALHKGFARAVSRDCMFCHNAFPDVPEGSDAAGEPALFPARLPEGVGCQRCHGPGAKHVELAFDVAPIEVVTAAILNPADLEPDRRADVCMQCHLQPSVAISPIRRFDRPDYSFRPGEALADYLVHPDPVEDRPRKERFEINHHAYRLLQSRCYVQSKGELSCLTCHDPHRKVVEADAKRRHYRAACESCHRPDECGSEAMTASGVETGDCVACHMPPRRTQDVVHAVMTDHLIVKRPEASEQRIGELAEAKPRVRDIELLESEHFASSPEGELYRAIAMVRAGSSSAVDKLQAAISAVKPASPVPLLELVVGQLRLGRFRDALATLSQVEAIAPDDPAVHAHFGVALSSLGRREAALERLQRAFELAPESPEVRYNLGKHLAVEGRNQEAATHLEAAVRLRPNLAAAWFDLGTLYANMGRLERAADCLRRTLVLEPGHQRASLYLDRLAGLRDPTPATAASGSAGKVTPARE